MTFTIHATEKTVYIYPDIQTKIDDNLWMPTKMQTLSYYEIYDHITFKNTTLFINNYNYYNQSNLPTNFAQSVYTFEDSSLLKAKNIYKYKNFNIAVFSYRKMELNDFLDKETNLYSFSNPIIFHDRVVLIAMHVDTNFLVINKFRIDGVEENKLALETQLKKIIDNTIFISPKKLDLALEYPITQKHQEDYTKNYIEYTLKNIDLVMKKLPNVITENAIREFADNVEDYLPKSNNYTQNTDDVEPNFIANIWWQKALKNKLKFNAYMDSLYVSLQKNWIKKYEPTTIETTAKENSSVLANLSIQEIHQYIKDNFPKAAELKLQERLNASKSNDDVIISNEESVDSVFIPSIEKTYEPHYDFSPFRNRRNNLILFQNFELPEIGFAYSNYYESEQKVINGEFMLNDYLNNTTEYESASIFQNTISDIKEKAQTKNNLERYKEMTSEYDNTIIENAVINKLEKEIFKGKYSLKYFVELGTETKYLKDKTTVSSIWFLCSPYATYYKDTITDYIVLSFTKNGNQWLPSYSTIKANFGKVDTEMPGVTFPENTLGKDYVVINYDTKQYIADKKNHTIGGWTTINKDDSLFYKTYPISFPNCNYSVVGCGDDEQANISVYETIINSTINPDLVKINELISKNKISYNSLFTTLFNEIKKYNFDYNQLPDSVVNGFTNQENIIEEINNKLLELQRTYCANLKPTERVYSSSLYYDDLNLDGKDEVFCFSISNGKLLEYNIYTIKNNKVVKYENANALKQIQNTKSYKLLEEKSKEITEKDISIYDYEDY